MIKIDKVKFMQKMKECSFNAGDDEEGFVKVVLIEDIEANLK